MMGIKITDLPILERPREKALRYGLESLSNEELLALIIGSGSKGNSAKDIAYTVLNQNKGLYQTSLLAYQDFVKFKGLDKAKALKVAAVFEIAKRCQKSYVESKEEVIDEQYIFEKYKDSLGKEKQEHLLLIILNRKKQIIHETFLYKGTNNNVPFSERDIFKELMINNAHCFYLIHNHPDGSLYPSEADIFLTEELLRKCKAINIPLIDHLIFTSQGYFSFKDNILNISKNNL